MKMKNVAMISTGIIFAACLLLSEVIISSFAEAADRLLVKNSAGTTTFSVEDTGIVTSASRLLTNGASAWGSAPFVLGQNTSNRGIVITDKAASNPKNIYIGWNVGTSHDYAEIFALQEGVAFKDVVLNPNGGYVGIGTTSPDYPLQMGSGAYVSTGGVWTDASSMEYKKDVKSLDVQEAIEAVMALRPVKFRYKADPEEDHVGFIAEEAPDIVATKDRKGMSAMDVVALLSRVVQAQQMTIEMLSNKVAKLEAHGK